MKFWCSVEIPCTRTYKDINLESASRNFVKLPAIARATILPRNLTVVSYGVPFQYDEKRLYTTFDSRDRVMIFITECAKTLIPDLFLELQYVRV